MRRGRAQTQGFSAFIPWDVELLRDVMGNWQHPTCVYRGHLADTMDLRAPRPGDS